MINIIDYGIGNLRSIEKAFEHIGVAVHRSDQVADLERADKLVLPGVGAFGACADEVRRRGLEVPIRAAVEAGKPLLGVCVGMQLLFDVSEEMGEHRGLGLLPGRVVKFAQIPQPAAVGTEGTAADSPVPYAGGDGYAGRDLVLKVPHMGWNTLYPTDPDHPLLEGITPGAFFYFVHSYYAQPADESHVLAHCHYGTEFPAIVYRDQVFGVQFHPEKSHRNGLRILENFAKL